MSIEYLTDLDCPVKQKFSPGGMKWWIMAKAQAEHIMKTETRKGKSEYEVRKIIYKYHLKGLNNSEAIVDKNIGEILDRARDLDEMRIYCEGCKASLGHQFGCYGRISYPITAEGERWLGEIAKSSIKRGELASFLVSRIIHNKTSGEPFSGMRKNPNVPFFELRKPIHVAVDKGLIGKKEVNTDQLLVGLFPVEQIPLKYALMLAHFSGGLKIQKDEPLEGTYESAFTMTDNAGNSEWWVFGFNYPMNENRSVRQLKCYFSACFRAFMIDKPISIDM